MLSVTPGMVKTEAMDGYLQSLSDTSGLSVDEVMQNAMKSIGGIPMGKMAEPEDIAELVGYVVSPKASYLTGANYIIEGGSNPFAY